MSVLNYIKTTLGMSTKEFMAEWRLLDTADQEWYREAAREDAEASGVEITTAP